MFMAGAAGGSFTKLCWIDFDSMNIDRHLWLSMLNVRSSLKVFVGRGFFLLTTLWVIPFGFLYVGSTLIPWIGPGVDKSWLFERYHHPSEKKRNQFGNRQVTKIQGKQVKEKFISYRPRQTHIRRKHSEAKLAIPRSQSLLRRWNISSL